ncbi:carboxymuconolactone decarboxylase family protein [Alteromonas hispanica]|uniref:Carboxymuconolactone decarboxylase family protein n=1 Tax=Alteromonas hispanica TaxID=315421 RepID=A0A6L9MS38_9ALTE|nr:carboxymuconolactone decarboxylase family protein [Alteromonas hispanica]NDW20927.1 carboxymuconolactone decarboxylase family protein [Alteromonas hispanica]
MPKSYKQITEDLNPYLAEVKKGMPEVMKGFSEMAKAATADGALDKKTKEPIALSIGIATRCDGCIGFHAKALVHLGATRNEIEEVCGMAIYMGGGPSFMYAADALRAFDEFSD